MSLNEYRRKRTFEKTPEPQPSPAEESHGNRFFVQRHSARRLHYDLRLEMDGALRSWALPNGPTLDPAMKRLAVLVEDHPLEYGSFEGTIPAGNYGAGKVTLWDRGIYEWLGTKTPVQQWEAGDLKLRLHGQKLMGEFALVRTKRAKGKDWLLIKKKDFAVREGWDPESDPRSVLESKPQLSSIEGAIEAPMPEIIAPMMAISSQSLPTGTDWLYEVKWDGVRALCFLDLNKDLDKDKSKGDDGGAVRILSRQTTAIEHQYPELQSLPEAVDAHTAILDGEIVCFDEKGIPSFQLLQNRIGAGPKSVQKLAQTYPASFFAFDLLYLDGYDLRQTPLGERKQLLAAVLRPNNVFRHSEHFTKGAELLQAVREKGLEGIVAKHAFSKYESKRSREWIKIKVVNQMDFVVCGWLKGERDYFGSLVLAYYNTEGKLTYAGNVGSGFNQDSLKSVYEKLEPLVTNKPPVPGVPKDLGEATWVKPEVVCTIRFSSWTDEERLRAPVFLGLRTDQTPQECVREATAPASESEQQEARPAALLPEGLTEVALEIDGRRLKFTNLPKVFYPKEGYTKKDVINFYAAVADLLVPHLRDRPLSLRRYPNGIEDQGFFQKEAPAGIPDWLRTEAVVTSDDGSTTNFVVADDKASVVYLANLGCIDQNPWMSRVATLENPDFILVDIDPYHCGYDRIIEAAQLIHQKLDQIGLAGYPKTTGGDGMHIYIPVEPIYTYHQTRSLAEILARWVASERPDLFTTPRTVASRQKGKVYFDYLQNASGKTISAPYVLRAYPGAPVATPLAWHEVKPGLNPTQFHIRNAIRRFERTGDLFTGVLKNLQRIEPVLEKIAEMVS
ncbi:MAG TPA: DNA ligase D [Candidatus Angelobacter sp.]|nr:DNA ligase D [Candidatus Angelobacter sp.]